MPAETHSASSETMPVLEELTSLSESDVAAKLQGFSSEVVEQLFNTLIVRLDTLAERSDDPKASEEYDRVNTVLDQVKARRGFQTMNEAV